jgi:hypothetical protein
MKGKRSIVSAKSMVGAVSLLCLGGVAFADCDTNGPSKAVVVPNYTAFNTTTAAAGTFADNSRIQQVYGGLQFPTGPILIKELRWRPNLYYGTNFSVTLTNVEIHLSTTAKSASTLSTTFASNVGGDDTTVYDGPLNVSTAFTGPAAGPLDADVVVKLQTPFWFTPSAANNLLVDLKVRDGAGRAAHIFVDAFGEANDTGARVVGFDSTATTATFSDTGVDAIKFIYDGPQATVSPSYTEYHTTTAASGTFADVSRSQQVYGALQFPSGPILIRELRWRPNVFYGTNFSATLTNVEIHLSSTAKSAGTLSTTFASNVGGNDTTVYSGPLTLSTLFTGPSAGPLDADIVVKLQTPFYYIPATTNNLLVDITVRDGAGRAAHIFVDAFGETHDTGSRVVGIGLNPTTATFSDTGVDSIKFFYDQVGVAVAPNYTEFNTTTAGSGTFADNSRSQQIYGASQFPTGPIVINELRWRPSLVWGTNFSLTLSNVEIHLSTTARSAGGLSTTFASNVGPDDTTVYSGALHLATGFTGPAGGPLDLDVAVPLQIPFLYTPAANNNLLLDIRVRDGSGRAAKVFVEAFGESNDTSSRVVGFDSSATTATFSDTGVDAVKFIYDTCSH